MIAELRLHRRIRVQRRPDGAWREGERSVLERANLPCPQHSSQKCEEGAHHLTASLPAEVAAGASFILRHGFGHLVERFARFQSSDGFEGARCTSVSDDDKTNGSIAHCFSQRIWRTCPPGQRPSRASERRSAGP